MDINKKGSPLKQFGFGGAMGVAINNSINNTTGARNTRSLTRNPSIPSNPLFGGMVSFNGGTQISNPQSINNNPLTGGLPNFNSMVQPSNLNNNPLTGGFMGSGSALNNAVMGAQSIAVKQKPAPVFTPPTNRHIAENSLTNLTQPGVVKNDNLNNNNMLRQQTPISPKAFSNQGTINDVYGQMVPGTYNRSVGSPLTQMVEPSVAIDPLTGQQIDPTMDQSTSMPLPPPVDVQTGLTPNYGINNV